MKKRPALQWAAVLSAFVAAAVFGCSAVNPTVAALEKAKAFSAEGRYEAAAAVLVTCSEAEPGCGQLNLVTGNACYRLAKSAAAEGNKEEAETRYRCAAARLEAGIAQTAAREPSSARAQDYVNWCESLRNLQDLEKGGAALQLSRRLLAASEQFLAAEPGHPAAVYFQVGARLAIVSPSLFAPADPAGLCRRLNRMIEDLQQAFPKAEGTRYEGNYRRLLADVKGTRQAIAGCR